jgi:hypothetical protein
MVISWPPSDEHGRYPGAGKRARHSQAGWAATDHGDFGR